jgi:hypothetical protein
MKRDRFGFIGDLVSEQLQSALSSGYDKIAKGISSTPSFQAGAAQAVTSASASTAHQAIGKKPKSLTGTDFASAASALATDKERQELAVSWLVDRQYPSQSLAFIPVRYTAKDASGKEYRVEIFVAPDYLATGTNDDKLIAELGLPNALRVANTLGFALPTPMIVDKIWEQATYRYEPQPLPSASGSTMRKPAYQLEHRKLIDANPKPTPGSLLAGHKKDVVLSSKLTQTPGRLAIYGWHRPDGRPIQGVSLFHGADYADYSHGIRPIKTTMLVDGRPIAYPDVLMDPTLHTLVSREPAFDPDQVTAAGQPWGMV